MNESVKKAYGFVKRNFMSVVFSVQFSVLFYMVYDSNSKIQKLQTEQSKIIKLVVQHHQEITDISTVVLDNSDYIRKMRRILDY